MPLTRTLLTALAASLLCLASCGKESTPSPSGASAVGTTFPKAMICVLLSTQAFGGVACIRSHIAIAFLISAPCFILAMNSPWLIGLIFPGGGTNAQQLIVAFLIASLYYWAPNVQQPAFRWITPGSVLAVDAAGALVEVDVETGAVSPPIALLGEGEAAMTSGDVTRDGRDDLPPGGRRRGRRGHAGPVGQTDGAADQCALALCSCRTN